MSKSQPVTQTTEISKAFGGFGKMLRTQEAEGVTMAHWQKPINDIRARRNLAEYLKAGCPKIDTNGSVVQSTIPEGEELAKLILGDDVITPEDIEAKTNIRYTDEQKAYAAETMPTDPDTLQTIKADNCMLIFGPSEDLTLLSVRNLDNQLFYSKTDGWYAEDNQKFARTDVVKAGQWLIIRKSPVANSTSKNWDEQQNLITKGNRVPNAAEMSYAVTIYYKVRGTYLLGNIYVRTSSVSAGGHRVLVGHFDSDGLHVSRYWDSGRYSNVGVASARE